MIVIKDKQVALTTPNKEIIRRICRLNGASKCYLVVDTNDEYVEILTDIPSAKKDICITELEEWAGVKFRIFNFEDDKDLVSSIKSSGEIILPIIF